MCLLKIDFKGLAIFLLCFHSFIHLANSQTTNTYQPSQAGIFLTHEDYLKGNTQPNGLYYSHETQGRWVVFSQNGKKVKIKADETKLWGFRDHFGFCYRAWNGKFYGIINDSQEIAIYSQLFIPKFDKKNGEAVPRYKYEYMTLAKGPNANMVYLRKYEVVDSLNKWLNQSGNIDLIIYRNQFKMSSTINNMKKYLEVVDNLNKRAPAIPKTPY